MKYNLRLTSWQARDIARNKKTNMKKWLRSFFESNVPEDIGEVLVEWEVEIRRNPQRSFWWYVILALVLIGLLVYSVLTANYLLAMILVIFGFIIIFDHYQSPRPVSIRVAEDGLVVGQKFYPHSSIASFWIAYNPPEIKYLYLDLDQTGNKVLGLPLGDVNPLELREVLEEYIEEDLNRENEILADYLTRKLKI